MSQTKVEAPFVEGGAGSSFKNLVINGDFRVFQRASGSTAIGNGTYSTADRYKTNFSNDGAGTTQQYTLTDSERATTGHRHAWQWDVGTADTSLAAGQLAYFRHFIEAQNCAGLAYGSSAAKTLTLSFWVKSSKTGTYCCTIEKHDSTTYNLPLEYTISSADTWEFKTLVVSPTAGSTSFITGSNGDIVEDNGKGITLYWWLAAGSDYTGGTNNTWSSNTNHLTTTNQVNWLDSTSNNFYITGIQFEVGDQATDFEHLPFDIQLQRCMRYYQKIADASHGGAGDAISGGTHYSGTAIYLTTIFHVPMRAEPSMSVSGGTNYFIRYSNGGNGQFDSFAIDDSASPHLFEFYASSGQNHSGGTAGHGCFVRTNNSAAKIAADAEL
tara:strand:- start:230 stop:1378 length:1149 start_codon:yes stop_codon:yes gene_type:complete